MKIKQRLKKYMPNAIYLKYYKKKFFNKVFFAYLIITVVANFFLFFILSKNLITIKSQQTIDFSNQIVATIDEFLDTKINNGKSIHQKLLQDKVNWNWSVSQLRLPAPEDINTANDLHQSVRQTAIATIHSIDSQINGVFLYSSQASRIFTLADLQTSGQDSFFLNKASTLSENSNVGTRLISGRMEENRTNSFSLFLVDIVRAPSDIKSIVGIIAMRFDSMNIRQSYRRFDPYLKGKIYVFDESHALLFDSTGQYKPEEGFPFDSMGKSTGGTFSTDNLIYNYSYYPYGGYYIVNIIPRQAIAKDVAVLQDSIFKVMMLVILMAILLTFLSTKLFSARLKVIKGTMESVKQGNLTQFKPQKTYEDEVGYIYTELVNMCAALDDHIQKEYVYKLKQKEMELYTLQTQINPHFLYNSLEGIRMNLYLKGETEASRMIRILSEMFRNMMRKDVVANIRDEINYVGSYLELYKFRFGSRMNYRMEISDEVYKYATIKHILQPIVENALVHGIGDTGTAEQPANIWISAWKQEDSILFSVSDDGNGIDDEKLAEIRRKLEQDSVFHETIGLYNVNSRMKIVYGSEYKLEINSKDHAGTQVCLKIKALTKKELESYVQGINR